MLRLAAQEAEGVITNWLAATDVPKIREVIGPNIELVSRVFVCPTRDADVARRIGRRMISSYLTVPIYTIFQEWLGRGDVLRPMLEAWGNNERKKANEAIPDSVVDELIIHGSPEVCGEKIRSYYDHGLDTPVITLLATGTDLSDATRTLAPAVHQTGPRTRTDSPN
ncbi:hypothetical protein GCM10027436_25260 [Actinophytocola sediminis]